MAIKCDNCSNDAAYTTAERGVNPAHYCTMCLPHWLQTRAHAGHFPLMETAEDKKKKTSKAKEPVEEVKVEEPVAPAEETVEPVADENI